MLIQHASDTGKCQLYVRYMKDGQLFHPPKGSRFVLRLDVPLPLPDGYTLDQCFMGMVTGVLITNGIRPEPYEINWSASDPYAIEDVPVPPELRAVVPLTMFTEDQLLTWFNHPNQPRFGGMRPSEIWSEGENGMRQVLDLAKQYVADQPLAAMGLRLIE